MKFDVIIIGGSYSGMAAALQLLRARKSVLILDDNQRRNRFANHSHGFLGQDGTSPSEIIQSARRQLEKYPTLRWIDIKAVSVEGTADPFTVKTLHNKLYSARRVLFATGVKDQLPAIEGLQERWGQSIFHCPYCHGYELNQGKIGIIGNGPMSVHQSELLTEWGRVTFLVNDTITLDMQTESILLDRGVSIEKTPIQHIESIADIRLKDGRLLNFDGLFTATKVMPSCDLAEKSGCVTVSNDMGTMIQTSPTKETSISGIYACGDTASMPHSVSLAVADGAMAGMQLHRSLVW